MIKKRKIVERLASETSCAQCNSFDDNMTVEDWCNMDEVNVMDFCDYWECYHLDVLCYDCYHRMRDEFESQQEDRASFQDGYMGEDDPEGTFTESKKMRESDHFDYYDGFESDVDFYYGKYLEDLDNGEVDGDYSIPEYIAGAIEDEGHPTESPEQFESLVRAVREELKKVSSTYTVGIKRESKNMKENKFSDKAIEIAEEARRIFDLCGYETDSPDVFESDPNPKTFNDMIDELENDLSDTNFENEERSAVQEKIDKLVVLGEQVGLGY